MNTRQIQVFIKKFLPDLKLEIIWISEEIAQKVFKKRKINFEVGIDRRKNSLFINKGFWHRMSAVGQRSLLLHELGHTCFKHKKLSPPKEELTAQLWALHAARKRHMPKVASEIFKQLKMWDCKQYWKNRYDRRYAMASRMAFKYGIENLTKRLTIHDFVL